MKLAVMKQEKNMILRISIGGSLSDAYFVYRGDLKEIKMLLLAVTEQITKLEKEPPISKQEVKL